MSATHTPLREPAAPQPRVRDLAREAVVLMACSAGLSALLALLMLAVGLLGR